MSFPFPFSFFPLFPSFFLLSLLLPSFPFLRVAISTRGPGDFYDPDAVGLFRVLRGRISICTYSAPAVGHVVVDDDHRAVIERDDFRVRCRVIVLGDRIVRLEFVVMTLQIDLQPVLAVAVAVDPGEDAGPSASEDQRTVFHHR